MKPNSRPPLSACLITLNCAHTLADTLRSLDFCEEIVVVDSGSVDGTQAVAAAFGARVLAQEWLGFGRQKQFAVDQATHDWVLCIDADEIVTPALKASIEQVLGHATHRTYQFPRCNRFLGRYLRHGEGYPDKGVRLFHRQHARWSDDAVHEKVIGAQDIGNLSGDLLHHSEDSLSSYLAKQDRYTTLAAHTLFERGKRSSLGKLLLSPIVRFVKFYLWRQGFRDGVPGMIHIGIGCFTTFLKYAKLAELHSKKAQIKEKN